MTDEPARNQTSNGYAEIAREWWRQYLDGNGSPDRAVRARLRRAHDWRDAMTEPAAIMLMRRLGRWTPEQSLTLATLLAQVKEDSRVPLLRALGHKTVPVAGKADADPPLLARSRFDRLMRSDADELPAMLIRLVRQLRGTANIGELAEAILFWPSESSRMRTQRKWAFDYFAASAANPDTADETQAITSEGTQP